MLGLCNTAALTVDAVFFLFLVQANTECGKWWVIHTVNPSLQNKHG